MAFSLNGFYPDPRGGGVRIHSYSSADAIATVRAEGYFNELADVVNVRDIILVTDTATPTAHWCIVLSNDGTTVDISDGTVIAETDTD